MLLILLSYSWQVLVLHTRTNDQNYAIYSRPKVEMKRSGSPTTPRLISHLRKKEAWTFGAATVSRIQGRVTIVLPAQKPSDTLVGIISRLNTF